VIRLERLSHCLPADLVVALLPLSYYWLLLGTKVWVLLLLVKNATCGAVRNYLCTTSVSGEYRMGETILCCQRAGVLQIGGRRLFALRRRTLLMRDWTLLWGGDDGFDDRDQTSRNLQRTVMYNTDGTVHDE